MRRPFEAPAIRMVATLGEMTLDGLSGQFDLEVRV